MDDTSAGIEIHTTVTLPITADNLPSDDMEEADGCAWRAIRCNPQVEGCEWRWQPLNWEAFSKAEPNSEMQSRYVVDLSKYLERRAAPDTPTR